MDVYHGMPYGNVIPVLVRSTADGTVTVTVNGNPFTGTAATATDDGLVLINVTGVTVPSSAVVTTPNDTETITLRPIPATGEVKLGIASCGKISNKPGYKQFLKRDVDCVVNIGDEFYPEFAHTAYGMTTIDAKANLTNASDVQTYYDKNRQCRRTPELKKVLTSRGYARIPDDHDMGCNEITWALAPFQAQHSTLTTVEEMRAIVDASAKSIHDYDQINPPNNDASVDVNPFYTRFDLGEHAEVFMLCGVCSGYDPTAADRLVKSDTVNAISALQEAWLLARLAASTKKIKLVLSPKMTIISEFANSDSWQGRAGWITQLDRILQAIHDDSPTWTVPGGCMFVCGDYHTPGVHASYAGVDGATYDHAAITCCPAGSTTTSAGAKTAWTRKNHDDGSGVQQNSVHPDAEKLKNIGIFTVPADGAYVEGEIVLASGITWWKGRVLAGENKLSYPENLHGV